MFEPLHAHDDYQLIADYAVIGNLRTAALVGRDGSVDWSCMPDLDAPSVFAAVLDALQGGRFRVAPPGGGRGEQRYIAHTNVVQTTFASATGRFTVTDWMPLKGSIISGGEPDTRPEICRLVECLEGAAEIEVEWSPRFGYAAEATRIEHVGDCFVARSRGERMALAGMPSSMSAIEHGESGSMVHARCRVAAGERFALVAYYGLEDPPRMVLQHVRRELDATIATWRDWVHARTVRRAWAGEWTEQVIRSELALKLLTYPRTGAIAAAATTSLPEVIGGRRNWDFRFSWIRDGALAVRALLRAGHRAEGAEFLRWAARTSVAHGSDARGLRIMYGLDGETSAPERELAHLDGYRGSRPVRIGNAAAEQRQHDVYGELLWAAHELARAGCDLPPELLSFLAWLADEACRTWREPDSGIWEMRTAPSHFVHSKVMAWVALDRAIRLSRRHGLAGDVARWRRERDAVRRAVLAHGVDRATGAFTLAFGSTELDAANLLIPTLGFLAAGDARVRATVDQTMLHLTRDGLVYRHSADDGLPAHANAFAPATFWLVDALAACGRGAEARELLRAAARRANHVGLYAEQFTPSAGQLLGNFPQAFTHVAFINSVWALARSR